MYLKSFPPFERFKTSTLLLWSLRKKVEFSAVYDGEKFCGLTYVTYDDDTVYLLYLAVSEKLRGQGYGSKILTMLDERFPDKQIVIDIEPVVKTAKNYQQRLKRLRFYQRNGFKLTGEKLVDDDGEFVTMVSHHKFDHDAFLECVKKASLGLYKIELKETGASDET
ncbi:MAG: GNAT family N-acetyltransferase [Lactobacillus sp.]|nr:GNAT family N-acetyltransferase [Lactobacillus sp.]